MAGVGRRRRVVPARAADRADAPVGDAAEVERVAGVGALGREDGLAVVHATEADGAVAAGGHGHAHSRSHRRGRHGEELLAT